MQTGCSQHALKTFKIHPVLWSCWGVCFSMLQKKKKRKSFFPGCGFQVVMISCALTSQSFELLRLLSWIRYYPPPLLNTVSVITEKTASLSRLSKTFHVKCKGHPGGLLPSSFKTSLNSVRLWKLCSGWFVVHVTCEWLCDISFSPDEVLTQRTSLQNYTPPLFFPYTTL